MPETSEDNVEVIDQPDASRYEIREAGELAGFAEYRLHGDVITFTHTEVDPERGGRGLGSRLIEFAVTDARSRELSIIPRCPFVRDWIAEHPEED
jgi:predicted GNAT family acetyltransferase